MDGGFLDAGQDKAAFPEPADESLHVVAFAITVFTVRVLLILQPIWPPRVVNGKWLAEKSATLR